MLSLLLFQGGQCASGQPERVLEPSGGPGDSNGNSNSNSKTANGSEETMSDIARAVLVGRLTKDPELNESGRVLTLGMAVNRRVKARDSEEWVEEVSFFDVKVLGNRAQGLKKFLEKGRQVAVDARIVQERWESQEGSKRSAVRFIADEVVPLGSKSENSSASSSDIPIDANEFAAAPAGAPADDDIPF